MMKLILALVSALLATVALAADSLNPTVLNGHVPDQYSSGDFALSAKDQPWFAYYGADNLLYVRRPDGAALGLGAADRPRQQSGLALAPVEEGMAVLWRDKLPRKHLYLIPKLDPTGPAPAPVVVAGEESEPLTRFKLERAGETEYLLWLGEKGDPASKEKYHLYFRAVEQNGKTLSPIERVMPGGYPAWIIDQDVITVFSWMAHEGKLAMAQRTFDRAKKTFGPVTKIADAPPIAPIFEAFKSGNRWFLLWLGQYEEGAKMLLEGVYSDDRGQTWKRFAMEDLRNLNIGGLSIATDHKGNLLIALDGNRQLIDADDKKNNVYVVRSTDNGTTWQKPQTVRSDDLRLTRAQYPVLALGAQPGTVMLAWEDWRSIRPNVYVSYSKDYGATWEPALPLSRPGVWNLGLEPQPRVLRNRGDRFWLVTKQYKDDALSNAQKDYVLYSLTWEEVQRNAAGFDLAAVQARATEARLRERAAQYWQAMQDGQYETTYALMDPFFRGRSDLRAYLINKGAVKYHRYKIGQIAQKDNIAKVEVEIESSVPEFRTPSGKTVSQPVKTIKFVETWVFVNNDWHREYYDEMAEKSSTSY